MNSVTVLTNTPCIQLRTCAMLPLTFIRIDFLFTSRLGDPSSPLGPIFFADQLCTFFPLHLSMQGRACDTEGTLKNPAPHTTYETPNEAYTTCHAVQTNKLPRCFVHVSTSKTVRNTHLKVKVHAEPTGPSKRSPRSDVCMPTMSLPSIRSSTSPG